MKIRFDDSTKTIIGLGTATAATGAIIYASLRYFFFAKNKPNNLVTLDEKISKRVVSEHFEIDISAFFNCIHRNRDVCNNNPISPLSGEEEQELQDFVNEYGFTEYIREGAGKITNLDMDVTLEGFLDRSDIGDFLRPYNETAAMQAFAACRNELMKNTIDSLILLEKDGIPVTKEMKKIQIEVEVNGDEIMIAWEDYGTGYKDTSTNQPLCKAQSWLDYSQGSATGRSSIASSKSKDVQLLGGQGKGMFQIYDYLIKSDSKGEVVVSPRQDQMPGARTELRSLTNTASCSFSDLSEMDKSFSS